MPRPRPLRASGEKPGSVPDAALWSRLSEAVSQTESVSGKANCISGFSREAAQECSPGRKPWVERGR